MRILYTPYQNNTKNIIIKRINKPIELPVANSKTRETTLPIAPTIISTTENRKPKKLIFILPPKSALS